MSPLRLAGLVLLFLFSSAFALQVTPGSPCAELCLDPQNGNSTVSSTDTSDIVCSDSQYQSDKAGIKFRTCMECMQNSTKVDGGQTDISWFLCENRRSRSL